MQPFAEACLASPMGAALVGMLERKARPGRTWITDDPTSEPGHVAGAVAEVHRMSFGELCAAAIDAAMDVGPWTSDAAVQSAAAFLHASERLPIAEAIASRFEAELHAPIDLPSQEWWLHSSGAAGVAPLFQHLDHVYANGELSWGALRSYGPSAAEVLDCQFGDAPPPATRWMLPVTTSPRVFEIHRPSDWHQLCVSYPVVVTRPRGCWELEGPLFRGSQRSDPSAGVDRYLCPRWSRVGDHYDAVHLSWAGFITSEGCLFTVDGTGTMLRFWDREVTMWLADCFGDPSPLPLLTHSDYVIDVGTSPRRLAQDQQVIQEMLGRPLP